MKKRECFSYALGGVGHNLVYALFSGYLLIFYTDVFGLSASFTGLLFLIARIFDAVNDPLMGILADRTKSRFGRYRVWLMRSAPVIAAALCLCFYAPAAGKTVQYIYCYVTYILLGVSFTCADIPYWTIPSVMTEDASERNKVFSAGSIAGCLASGVGAVAVPVIVSMAPSHASGYLLCAVIFSCIALVCYYVCAFSVRERIAPERRQVSFRSSLRAIVGNKPLCITMAASLFGNLAFQLKVAMNTYYGQYSLGDYGYVTYLSAMLLVGMLIGSGIIPMLVKKFGAKNAMIGLLACGVAISVAYYASGYQNLVVVLVFSALCAVVVGGFSVLVNTMTADAIDYAELQSGERNEGIITSTRTFITKLATAIAGAGAAFILDAIGYVPNALQSGSVKQALHSCMSLWPGLLYVPAILLLCFYPLTKARFEQLQKDLARNRRK